MVSRLTYIREESRVEGLAVVKSVTDDFLAVHSSSVTVSALRMPLAAT